MRHSQKAKYIISICMLLIGFFSAYSLYKAFRPSAGSAYEVLTVEQAEHFMQYESGFALVDIRDEEDYARWHMTDAVNIPYDKLVESALTYLPDKTGTIYVYADNDALSSKACVKLTGLGYDSVAQITGVSAQIDES